MEEEREYLESAPDVLFVLKVDMGGGQQEYIHFCRDDSPEDLAFAFCQQFGLNVKVYDFVADSLRQKYHQLQTGQLTESKSRAAGSKAPVPKKQKSAAKQCQTPSEKRLTEATSSQRLFDRPTAADSNPNLLASSTSRGFLVKEHPTDEYPREACEVTYTGRQEPADVYARLFSDAKKKQRIDPLRESAGLLASRPKSAESSKRSVGGYQASNRLYYCGVKNKALREQEYAHIEKLRSAADSEGLTFTPQINPVSQVLAASRASHQQLPAHERLLASGKATAKKKELFREMHQQIESSKCKFRPAIDPM